MVAEEEIRLAVAAGEKFRQAIYKVVYDAERDFLVFETPWGMLSIKRTVIPDLRDVSPKALHTIEVSSTAIHIGELDLDINSAGLLAEIFREIEDNLTY
jgi:hypothetical protein